MIPTASPALASSRFTEYTPSLSANTTAPGSPNASSYDLAELARSEALGKGKLEISEIIPESRVLIIMTGGTICMRRSENGYVPSRGFLEYCLKVRPSFNDGSETREVPVVDADGNMSNVKTLRTPLSKYGRTILYAALEFDPLLDSSSINAKGWGKIARAIERNYKLFDAFVILHGTDSLAYTSSALSFMISNLGKPVILTGSQAPMTELHNDATDNLLGSLIIAGHYMIPEVCLFFNHKLYRGNRCTKTNAHDFKAFSSPNFPPLAKVGISTTVHWDLVLRPNRIQPFSIQPDLETSHVACLRIFPGILPEMVRGILALKGLRGLVLETFGSGNAPEDDELIKVLREGIERGVVIVSVTQCQVGTVTPLYAAGTTLAKAGVVFGLDMTSEAALTKLSCLLANPVLTVAEVAHQMFHSLRGELTEAKENSFSHPTAAPGYLPPKLTAMSALGYAIADGDTDAIDAVLKESKEFLLNSYDYSGSNALHLAAITSHTHIVKDFLSRGASVHLRNREGHTPLFLAAEAGRKENVRLLRESGAHLHAEETEMARILLGRIREGSGTLSRVGTPVSCDVEERERRTKERVMRFECWRIAGAEEGEV